MKRWHDYQYVGNLTAFYVRFFGRMHKYAIALLKKNITLFGGFSPPRLLFQRRAKDVLPRCGRGISPCLLGYQHLGANAPGRCAWD
ncbi:MAG TPA: hypothetical protein DCF33_12365 [Saprospirales bacterium]|nr:hypothetical protein [Saprospirales bacterium]